MMLLRLLLLLASPLEVSLDRLRQAATRKQCRVCTTATLEEEEDKDTDKDKDKDKRQRVLWQSLVVSYVSLLVAASACQVNVYRFQSIVTMVSYLNTFLIK
jgi:hypothetical protein